MRTQTARLVDLDNDLWRLPSRVNPAGWLARNPVGGIGAGPGGVVDPLGDQDAGSAGAPSELPRGGTRRRPRRTAEARAARERELARRRQRRQRRALVAERSAGPVETAWPPGKLSPRRVVEPVDVPAHLIGRWGRLMLTILSLATLALIAARLVAGLTAAAVEPVDVTVRPGDTLWSIAAQAAPSRDPRAVIDEMRELNQISGDVVRVGEVLRVPVSPDRGSAE